MSTDWEVRGLSPDKFSPLQNTQTGTEAHTASYAVRPGVVFR